MEAFAKGIIVAAVSLLLLAQGAIALGLEPPGGKSIHVAWLLLGNLSSLLGAASVAIFSTRERSAAVMPAMLVWGATSMMFMHAFLPDAEAPIQLVHLSR
jgi:hypothetical protein